MAWGWGKGGSCSAAGVDDFEEPASLSTVSSVARWTSVAGCPESGGLHEVCSANPIGIVVFSDAHF